MFQNIIKPTETRLHLLYLDGLRGLAALYVVLHHLWLIQGENLPGWLNLPTKSFKFGLMSVVLFMVLSGYALMLPVARSEKGYIPGSLSNYFKRRSLRILPPYYITLGICLLLAFIIWGLEKISNFQWQVLPFDMFSPDFSFLDVILHSLLIHNFSSGYQVYYIHTPMWSIPLEWQAYLLFPLLFLPLWRRWGFFAAIAVALIISLTPVYFLDGFMKNSRPWMLASFTFGMAAADIGFSQKPLLIKLRTTVPWNVVAVIFVLLTGLTESEKLGLDKWISHSCAGLAFASLMVYCTSCLIEKDVLPVSLRFLESRIAIALAKFSYSLYLSHAIVVTFVRHFLLSLQLSPTMFAVLLYAVAVPLSLVVAYGFYLVFERPFLSSKVRQKFVGSAN
ncbi:MAG: acyltransferase [Cyanomargarita calcarea GSE-NOS-MK-12-04C]|jgi:peptidoglycan/LPS O-acetylase OafA/YrhL|uniref:Acyltransferase n=1 Tax=Cyanomargarita calcarea GSE-NOS-MK-12-04C TaxID=2839659 RepID=A0A951QPH0_9CYAN|nr:acyltransferase [Cyanomargarita calcarea GSE-NOS-MK-12-04C]